MLAFLAKFPVSAAIYLAAPKGHVEVPDSVSYLNVYKAKSIFDVAHTKLSLTLVQFD